MLESFEWIDRDLVTIMQCFAGMAVFIDQAIDAPGQVVLELVIGELG